MVHTSRVVIDPWVIMRFMITQIHMLSYHMAMFICCNVHIYMTAYHMVICCNVHSYMKAYHVYMHVVMRLMRVKKQTYHLMRTFASVHYLPLFIMVCFENSFK